MRVPRNYMNGMAGGNGINGMNSLLQRALSRSSKSRKTGRSAALLNSVNNRNNILTKNNATAAQTQKLYYNMKYHAGQVMDYAAKLTDKGDKSLFAKAKESGDTAEIVANIKGFVSQYNSMLANLRESGTITDNSYLTQLNSTSVMNRSGLESCGVTRNADGTLKVDEEKLAATDIDTLEKVWNGSSSFASRASLWADSIEANAERSMKAELSSSYSNLFKNYGNSGNYFNYFR